ncbi:MAG: malectin domain-containing carbohydrate-binding protein [Bacteroidota bacterium]
MKTSILNVFTPVCGTRMRGLVLTGLLLIGLIVPLQAQLTIFGDPDGTTLEVGETITVTVKVDAGTNTVTSAQVGIDYDVNEVSISNVANAGNFAFTIVNDASNGRIRFAAGAGTASGVFDVFTFELTALQAANPTNLTFDPDPTQGVNFNDFTVAIDDISYVISAPNTAPTINSVSDQVSVEGDVINLQLVGMDADNNLDEYQLIGGSLPGGLTLDANTGLISGTISVGAAASSPYQNITIEVVDDQGATSDPDAIFNWTVTAPNQNPTVSVVSPTEGVAFGNTTFQDVRFPSGSNIPLTVNATDSDGNISTVEFFDGGGSLGFGTADGGGDYTNTVPNAPVGSFQFSATATDNDGGTGSSAQSDQITVFPRTKSIPGIVEAEDFIGRTSAILVQANGPTEPAGLHIGSIQNNSSTDYEVDVSATTTTYDVVIRAASNEDGGTITFRDGAANVLGTVDITGTGGWQTYQDFTTQLTFVTTGVQQLFMDYTGGGFLFNVNWVEFTEVIPNTPPTIAGIDDQTNQEGDAVNLALAGFATDTDGSVVEYILAGGSDALPAGLSLNMNTGLISGTISAGAAAGSTYTIIIQVTDDDGDTDEDTFIWTVTVPNIAPTVTIVSPEITGSGGMIDYASVRFPSGDDIDLVVDATDTDGTISTVVFEEDGGPTLGAGVASGGDSYTYTINNATVGSFAFNATATDNLGATGSAASPSDEITVFERTKAIPGIVEGEDFLLRSPNIKVQVNGGAEPAGFHAGFIENGSSTQYEVNVTSAGVYDVVVRAASDQTGGTITFKDGGGNTLGTVVVSNTGDWQDYEDFAGQVEFTSTGIQTLELEYSNGGTFLFNLNRVEFSTFVPNQLPTIANIPDQTNEEGDMGVSLNLATFANDSDGTVDNYTLASGSDPLPAGLSLDNATGVISGDVNVGAAANSPYAITIEVTDNEGDSSDPDASFTWTVNEPPNVPPTVMNIPDQTNTEGDVVNFDLSTFANDVDGTVVNYALANGSEGLPDGLSLDSGTGLITGTPTAAAAAIGSYFNVIEVTDDEGATSNPDDDFIWTINPLANDPPMIDAIATQEIDNGDNLQVNIQVTDEGTPTVSIEIYDISIVGTNNPFTPGGTVSPADYTFVETVPGSGSYLLVWNTDASDARAYEARVTADDGVNDAVTTVFDINIAQDVPGQVESNTLKNPKPYYILNPSGSGFTVTMENNGPVFNMGFIDNGDFLDYLIDVPAAGTYNFLLRAAKGNNSGPGGITTVSFSEENGGGFNVLGTVAVPNPANNPLGGGWQDYFDYTTQITFSSAGVQTVRLSFNAGANVDYFTISPANNVAPTIVLNPSGDQSMNEGQSLNVSLTVADTDGDISGNTMVDGPAFMTVTPTTNTANDYVASLDFNPGMGDAGVYTINVTTNDGSNPPVTESFQLLVIAPIGPCDVKYRVNAGGPLVAGNGGDDFEGDTGGSPSPYLVQGNEVFSITRPITNTTGYPSSLFQSERYQEDGDLVYAFPVVTGGEYEVRLLFAEIWNQENNNAGNNRIFDIVIEGTLVEDNFRPFVAAGNLYDASVVQSYTVTAQDATLNILLSPENQNPALKAIEICTINEPAQTFTIMASAGAMGSISPSGNVVVPAGADQTFTIEPTPGFIIADVVVDGQSQGPISSYTFTNVQADGTISASFTFAPTFTITATAGTGGSISPDGMVSVAQGADQSFTITPDAGFAIDEILVDGVAESISNPFVFTDVQMNRTIDVSFVEVPFAPIYINVGGPAYTSVGGIDFAADNGEFNGTVFPTGAGQITTLNNTDFQNTDDDDLFRTERFAMTINGAFTVPNGDYVVDLYFAEIFQGVIGGGSADPNERVFDVLLEGNIVQDDLDLLDPSRGGAFAPATGIIKSFQVTVSDGELNVGLIKSIDNAKLGAICIREAGTPNAAPVVSSITDAIGCAGQTISAGILATDDQTVSEFQLQLKDSNGDVVPESEYDFTFAAGLASFSWVTEAADIGMYTATVLAFDGFDVSAGETFNINVLDNTPPTVTITAPADGASVMRATPINFVATATDAEDGDLTASIVWSSIDDSSFSGIGGNLTTQLLGLGGTYTITASVTDACGVTGSASITLEVPVPEVSFITPTENQVFDEFSIPVEVLPVGLDLSANAGGEHFHFYLNPDNPADPDFANRISTASQPGVTTFTFDQNTMTTATGEQNLLDPGENTLVVIAAESNHTEFQNPEARDVVNFFIGNTITASAGAGGSINPVGDVLVPLGGDQSFTITPDPGFEIADVLVDGNTVGAVGTYDFTNVTADATIEAFFSAIPVTYTITASAGAGGMISPSGVVTVAEGGDQSFTITPDAGFEIADVLVDGNSVGAVSSYDFIDVQADATIEAFFSALPVFYTITASAGVGGMISPSGVQSVAAGGSLSFTITPDAGFEIADVLVDGSSVGAVSSFDFTNVTADATIEASFTSTALLIYGVPDNTTINVGDDLTIVVRVAAGSNVVTSAQVGIDFDPAEVQINSISGGPNFTTIGNGTFFDNSFPLGRINYAGAFGSVSGDFEVFSFELTALAPANTADLVFDLNMATGVNFNDYTVTADDINILIEPSFIITATATGNGSISPSGAVAVAPGGDQSFTITPDAGFEISDVLVNGSSVGSVNSFDFINVQADATIEAVFTPIEFTITASAGVGGMINPSGAVTVAQGANQSFTITPDTGFEIVEVLVNGISEGAVSSFEFVDVQADATIEAVFGAVPTFTITASAGTGGDISPMGAVTVAQGADQSFIITPDAGFEIVDVLVDGLSVGAVSSYTFADVQMDGEIEAFFDLIPVNYTITATAGVGGAISPSGMVTVAEGADQSFTITPNAGFEIADVLVDGVSQGAVPSFTFTNVMADATITASFTAAEISIFGIPDNATINVGDNLVVAVWVAAGDNFVTSAQVGINFDPAEVQINSITAGPNFTTIANGTFFDNNAGRINYAGAFGNVNGDFEVFSFELTALAPANTADLLFDLNPTTGVNFNDYQVSADDVNILIEGQPAVPEAYVAINPSGGNINSASTFGNGFIVTNNSSPNVQITSVTFDLSTAIYPGNVFDPVGTAGDATAKCVTLTGGSDPVGLTIPGNGGSGADPDCTTPFSQPNGNGGFDQMTLDFTDFDPGESINVAVDVDPVSIEGFNAAGNAGAVSGLELIGSTVTVTFSDGSTYVGELYRIQENSVKGSENTLKTSTACAAPGLVIDGVTGTSTVPGFTDAQVPTAMPTAVVSGTPGENVTLLVIESSLEDLGPGYVPSSIFETNKAQNVTAEIDAVIPADGTLEQALNLTDAASGEVYHVVAVKVNADGTTCNTSQVWRLRIGETIPKAYVAINPGGSNINSASTFGSGFIVTNESTPGVFITDVTFDLSTAIYPRNVFDPVGTAGDATAKCVTIVGGQSDPVGLTISGNGGSGADPDCTTPFSQPNGNGGFDKMTLSFTDFDPTETINVAVDVDPVSIEGFNAAGNAGAVSGLELIGSTVTVTFSDGSVFEGEVYRIQPNNVVGSENTLMTPAACAAPGLIMDGLTSTVSEPGFLDAFTASSTPTAVISGTPGENVSLLVIESSLEDLGPGYVPASIFEANKAQNVTAEIDGVIPADGTLEVPLNLTDDASGEVYHVVAVKVNADGSTCNTSEVWRLRIGAAPMPMALFEITPGQGLGATTFGGSDKFVITNQSMGGVEITSVLVDFRTGILPDMVFDPIGEGGDSGAQCFNPASTAAGVGLLTFGDNCSDPFGFPRFGGFDVISLEFDDFDPGESFSWSVDVDPNSINGVGATGAAGAVSGLELVGATITITFSDGSVVVSNLFEDGSNGGGQTLSPTNAEAPTLEFVDVVGTESLVDDLNQTAHIIGGAANAGNYYALLQLDGRLLVPNGFTPFNVPDPTFYANEVMARVLYTGQLNAATGEAFVPLTLLQTVGNGGTVNGGKNHFMVVVSPEPYAPDQKVSATSNRVVLVFDPNLPVELLGFRGQLQDPHVKLDWETASELNNDRFEIERSLDGFSFDYIGEVAGIGQSEISNFYDYLDRQAALLPTEELFYRLRQVDFDGSFNYSPIIRIELEDKGPEYLLYTVDPGRNFRVEETTGEGIRELELYTISGQSLGRYSYDNATMVDIPTATLPPGTYLIVIDDQYRERIVLTR